MSSVLHPVGPEPRERYWVRRLAVLVAAVAAIVVVIALVGNAMSAGSAVQAEPAPPSVAAPTLPPVSASASPTTGDPSATPSVSSGAPTSGSTASPTPGPTPSSTAEEQEAGAEAKAADKKAADKKAADKKAAEKKAADKKAAGKKSTEQPVYATCDGSSLRPTLTGDPRVKVGKKTTFALSLINGGKKTCTARVAPGRAALTIVSGSDRIWSSKDCPEAMPVTKRTLLPEHSLEWKVTWDGTRSGDGCSAEEETPRKGYYWAIASVDGADSVRFRVILT